MDLHIHKFAEILSDYTSSSKAFVTLQYLIINSLMNLERNLFVY